MVNNLVKILVVSFQLFIGMFLITGQIYAQAPPPSPALVAQTEAMKKIEKMVGNWEGQGWYEMVPGRRSNFKSTEIIEKRLNGLVILVEGVHKAQIPNKSEDVVIHHALAVITYDTESKSYSFRPHLANGNSSNAEATINQDGAFVWGFKLPNGQRYRYTITIDKDQWTEIGELSMDENKWQKFFEMNLKKQ